MSPRRMIVLSKPIEVGLVFWVLTGGSLVFQRSFRLSIQPSGIAVDDGDFPRVASCPGEFVQMFAQHVVNERGTRLLCSRQAIDCSQNIFRECDRCLLFHTTSILPSYYSRDTP